VARIYNKTRKEALAGSFELADTFSARARGLMFRRRVERPLLFVFDEGRNRSAQACAIHSFFVFFTYSAIYLDGQKRVLEAHVGKPFISFIVPRTECAYLIEGEPRLVEKVRVGDVLEF